MEIAVEKEWSVRRNEYVIITDCPHGKHDNIFVDPITHVAGGWFCLCKCPDFGGIKDGSIVRNKEDRCEIKCTIFCNKTTTLT